jgi:hypothetical protein
MGTGPYSIILKLQRRAEAKPFSEPEIDALRRIRPHLQEAGDSGYASPTTIDYIFGV